MIDLWPLRQQSASDAMSSRSMRTGLRSAPELPPASHFSLHAILGRLYRPRYRRVLRIKCSGTVGTIKLLINGVTNPVFVGLVHDRSLYWRSQARSPHWASVAAASPGHISSKGAHQQIGARGVHSCSRRIGSVRESYVIGPSPSLGTLRSATLHLACPAVVSFPRTVSKGVQGVER